MQRWRADLLREALQEELVLRHCQSVRVVDDQDAVLDREAPEEHPGIGRPRAIRGIK